MVAGGVALLGAALWPSDGMRSDAHPSSAPIQVAQTPLTEKQRLDLDYQQRLNADKSRSDAASDAARAQAELDAQRRAADLARQQSLEAERQRQLDDLKRNRLDQPQPVLPRPYQ
jgi:hypothetical protein